jgi:hypothetical protein
MTRNGHEWTDRLPAVATMVAQVNVQSAVLDGELVALRADGVSSFPDLQARYLRVRTKSYSSTYSICSSLTGGIYGAASSPIARQHWNVGSIGQGCCGSAGIPMAI